jgi:hypothetical protein
VLEGELLVGAVGGLPQAHDHGVADQPIQRLEVIQRGVGIGGGKRLGLTLQPIGQRVVLGCLCRPRADQPGRARQQQDRQ